MKDLDNYESIELKESALSPIELEILANNITNLILIKNSFYSKDQ